MAEERAAMVRSVRKQRLCSTTPGTKATIRTVVKDLKIRSRWPDAVSGRRVEWSVDCGVLTEADLKKAVAALKRSGVKCSFERDYGTIVHFNLTW
jgi:hypothetical protein